MAVALTHLQWFQEKVAGSPEAGRQDHTSAACVAATHSPRGDIGQMVSTLAFFQGPVQSPVVLPNSPSCPLPNSDNRLLSGQNPRQRSGCQQQCVHLRVGV